MATSTSGPSSEKTLRTRRRVAGCRKSPGATPQLGFFGNLPAGFTLLELAIVLLVVAISASFVIPRLRDTDTLRLTASASRLASTTRFLYEEAAFRQRPMRLNFDLDRQVYWVTVLDLDGDTPEFAVDETPLARPETLPDGVTFRDVVLPAFGSVGKGIVFAQFHPEGFADPLVVHLEGRGGGQATLAIEPLTGRTRVADGYVDVRLLAELSDQRAGREGAYRPRLRIR